MAMARLGAIVNRRFSVQGLGLGEFMVLYYLDECPDGKMCRVDLAEKLGLTASGITRMLLPMEKIGLVKRVSDESDARVTRAAISASGRRELNDALERAGLLAEEILNSNKHLAEELSKLL